MNTPSETVIDTWELDEPYHELTLSEVREQTHREVRFPPQYC